VLSRLEESACFEAWAVQAHKDEKCSQLETGTMISTETIQLRGTADLQLKKERKTFTSWKQEVQLQSGNEACTQLAISK